MKLSRFAQVILLLPLVLFACSTVAEDDSDAFAKPARDLAELKGRIETILQQHNVPGAGISIVDKSGEQLVAGLGFANAEEQRKASAETLFRMGSISKMFVSLAALKLQEEDKLNLNDEVKPWQSIIDYQNPYQASAPIRIVHLLEHTAGWDDIHLTEFAHQDPTPATLEQGLQFHPHSRISRWPAGQRMSYSNAGPPAVARIIEQVAGVEFESYVQKNFFQPLDMMTATYREPSDPWLAATLYSNGAPVNYWHIIMRPSGAINASARDMANLLSFFIHRGQFNGERILSEASMRRMERPVSSMAARKGMTTGYGLSNYTTLFNNFVFHGHNGGVEGGIAELAYEHTIGVGYSIMLNSDNGSALKKIATEIKRYITFGHSGPKRIVAQTMAENIYMPYQGTYLKVNPRQEFSFFIDALDGYQTVKFNNEGAVFNDDPEQSYIWASPNMLARPEHSRASVILLDEQEDTVIQRGTDYLVKVPNWLPMVAKVGLGLFVVAVILHLLWFWIWLVRRLNHSIPAGPATRIRLAPFFASLSVATFIGLFIAAQLGNFLANLGQPSFYSWGIWLSTWCFAGFTLVALVNCWRYWSLRINRATRYFCLLSSLVYLIATVYFMYFGVIGLKTFA